MQIKNIIFATVKHLPILTKVLLMLVSAALIPLMFPNTYSGEQYDYVEGSIWRDNDLVAPFDFAVKKSPSEIEQETNAAKAKQTLYFNYNKEAYAQAVERLNALTATHPYVNLKQLRKTLDSVYAIGYIQTPSEMPDFKTHELIILDGNIGSEHSPEEYITEFDITDNLLRDSVMIPNIVYDANRTQLELNSRISQLTTTSGMVKQGQLIISQGQTVTKEQALIISSLEEENSQRFQEHYSPFGRFVGQFMLCIFAFLALYMFLKNTHHPILVFYTT